MALLIPYNSLLRFLLMKEKFSFLKTKHLSSGISNVMLCLHLIQLYFFPLKDSLLYPRVISQRRMPGTYPLSTQSQSSLAVRGPSKMLFREGKLETNEGANTFFVFLMP